jgi:nitroreductase
MDISLLKQAIDSSQHCQRNWDLTKSIDPSHMDAFVHAVTQCPSKQNHACYTVKFITNRDIIEQIYNNTYSDKSNKYTIGDGRLNPQVLANVLVLFEGYSDEYILNKLHAAPDGNLILEKEGYNRFKDIVLISVLTSIGIASGYLNLIANQLGYKTGFCECFDKQEVAKILNTTNTPRLFLGIGYPDDTKKHFYNHVDNSIISPIPKSSIDYSFVN